MLSSAIPFGASMVKMVLYNIDEMNNSSIASIFNTLFHDMRKREVNFVVFSTGSSELNIIKKVRTTQSYTLDILKNINWFRIYDFKLSDS